MLARFFGADKDYLESSINVLLSVILGFVIGWTYIRAYPGLLLSPSFVHTCVVTVLLVAFVVAAVRNSGLYG